MELLNILDKQSATAEKIRAHLQLRREKLQAKCALPQRDMTLYEDAKHTALLRGQIKEVNLLLKIFTTAAPLEDAVVIFEDE